MAIDGTLPAGVRFYPTEPELVGFYLRNKLEHRRPDMERFIPVVDVYSYEPMELPLMSGEASVRDPEQWFFFCPRQAREAQGGRPTRTTRSGYWKATGSPTPVFHDKRIIGIRKTMVFYQGRAPTGHKTSWKMNEYRAANSSLQVEDGGGRDDQQAAASTTTTTPSPAPAASSTTTTTAGGALKWRSEFSLCRVYKKSGHLRSFDRRPIVGVERESPAGVDDVHVVPSVTSTPPPDDCAMANNMREFSTSDGQKVVELGEEEDDDDDLEGLDWDSLIGFDRI